MVHDHSRDQQGSAQGPSSGPSPEPGLGIAEFVGIGSYNLACILGFMGLGWWGDASFGLTPVLTLLGLALGVAVGVLGTWLRLRPLLRGGGVAGDHHGPDDV
jgi:hypothetical protein